MCTVDVTDCSLLNLLVIDTSILESFANALTSHVRIIKVVPSAWLFELRWAKKWQRYLESKMRSVELTLVIPTPMTNTRRPPRFKAAAAIAIFANSRQKLWHSWRSCPFALLHCTQTPMKIKVVSQEHTILSATASFLSVLFTLYACFEFRGAQETWSTQPMVPDTDFWCHEKMILKNL